MKMVDYQINPVLMGGIAKKTAPGTVKINLFGRLGVIYVPVSLVEQGQTLAPGTSLQFYFSYIQVVDAALDCDYSSLQSADELIPCLIGGTIVEVNDTAAKIEIGHHLGTVAVPRRWLFTNKELEVGQLVEFYMSYMQIKTTNQKNEKIV